MQNQQLKKFNIRIGQFKSSPR